MSLGDSAIYQADTDPAPTGRDPVAAAIRRAQEAAEAAQDAAADVADAEARLDHLSRELEQLREALGREQDGLLERLQAAREHLAAARETAGLAEGMAEEKAGEIAIELEEAQARAMEALDWNTEIQTRLSELEAAVAAGEAELASLERQEHEATGRFERAQQAAQTPAAGDEVADHEDRAALAREGLASCRSDLEQAERQLADARARVEEHRQTEESLGLLLQQAQAQITSQEQLVGKRRDDVAEAEAVLISEGQALEAKRAELQEAQAAVSQVADPSEIVAAANRVAELAQGIQDAEDALEPQRQAVTAATEVLAEAEEDLADTARSLEQLEERIESEAQARLTAEQAAANATARLSEVEAALAQQEAAAARAEAEAEAARSATQAAESELAAAEQALSEGAEARQALAAQLSEQKAELGELSERGAMAEGAAAATQAGIREIEARAEQATAQAEEAAALRASLAEMALHLEDLASAAANRVAPSQAEPAWEERPDSTVDGLDGLGEASWSETGDTREFEAPDLAEEPADETPALRDSGHGDFTFWLTVATADGKTQRLSFDTDVVTIGRDPTCEVHLDNLLVSRRHAEIRRNANFFAVLDLETANGTYVNGRRIQGLVLLNGGDGIGVGKYRIRFEADTSDGFGDVPELTREGSDIVELGGMTLQVSPEAARRASTPDQGPRGYVLLPRPDAAEDLKLFVGDTFLVGKARECDLVIKGWFVPKKAAMVVRGADRYSVLNVGPSARELKVNGEEVRNRRTLRDGDLIEVYGESFRFVGEGSD